MSIYIGTTEITQSGSGLPSTYQEVEYIESSGTQYIDTGFKPSNTTKVICKACSLDLGKGVPIYGVGVAGSYQSICLLSDSTNYRARFRNGSSSNATVTSSVPVTSTPHIFNHSQSDGFYIDNVLIGTFPSYSFTETRAIYLFGWNSAGSFTAGGSHRIYYLEIYSSGTLVRNFIPCYRKSDSVIGLYDLVNNQFYTNSGTGTFSKGSNVTAKGIYVGTTPVKEVYVGTTKVRPSGWTPGANTLAYYPLTATSTVNDNSRNNYNLTKSGNVSFGTYAGVSCSSFSGSMYLYGGPTYTSPQNVTLSIWVYCIGSNTGTDPIYFGGAGFWIDYYYSYEIRYSPGSTNTNTYLPLNKWCYLTYTIDTSGTIKAYYNGTQIGTVSGKTPNSGTIRIGCSGSNSDFWKGYLSEAIIENKVWTATEISNYYNKTKSNYGL